MPEPVFYNAVHLSSGTSGTVINPNAPSGERVLITWHVGSMADAAQYPNMAQLCLMAWALAARFR